MFRRKQNPHEESHESDRWLSPEGLKEREIAELRATLAYERERGDSVRVLYDAACGDIDRMKPEISRLKQAAFLQRIRKDHSCSDDRAYVLKSVYEAEIARSSVRLDQIESLGHTVADLRSILDAKRNEVERLDHRRADLVVEVEGLNARLRAKLLVHACVAPHHLTAKAQERLHTTERQLAVARRWNDRLKAGWRKQVQRLDKRHETLLNTLLRVQQMNKDCITAGELRRSQSACEERDKAQHEVVRLRARLEEVGREKTELRTENRELWLHYQPYIDRGER